MDNLDNERSYIEIDRVRELLEVDGYDIKVDDTSIDLINMVLSRGLVEEKVVTVGPDDTFGPFGIIAMSGGAETVHYLDFDKIAICKLVEVVYNGGQDE